MSHGLLPLLLIATVTAPSHCASPRLPEASLCAPDTSLGRVGVVGKLPCTGVGKSLYVQPDAGFEGVTLEAECDADGEEKKAFVSLWFPLEETCFEGDADWWAVEVKAQVVPDTTTLQVSVRSGRCGGTCLREVAANCSKDIVVYGHGPSAWRLSRPGSECSMDTHTLPLLPASQPSCEAAPPPLKPARRRRVYTYNSSGSLTVGIIIIAIVVFALMVVMAWCYACCMKKRQQQPLSEEPEDNL